MWCVKRMRGRRRWCVCFIGNSLLQVDCEWRHCCDDTSQTQLLVCRLRWQRFYSCLSTAVAMWVVCVSIPFNRQLLLTSEWKICYQQLILMSTYLVSNRLTPFHPRSWWSVTPKVGTALRNVGWLSRRVLTLTPDLLLVRFCRELVRRPTLFFKLTAQLSHPRAVMIIPLFFLSFHLLIFYLVFFSCVKHTLSSFSCRAQLPRTSSWAAPASVAKLACPSFPICTAKTK